MNCLFKRSVYVLVVAILLADFVGVSNSFATEDKKINTTIYQKRRFSIITTNLDETNGPAKWEMTVHANGQKYHILDNTVITGVIGEAVTMNGLAVPCNVEVIYKQLNKNVRNALSIRIIKLLPGSSTSWPAEIPE